MAMFGRATRNDVLRSYTPTMAERIPIAVQGFLGRLGLNKYQARSFGQPIADVLGYSPVGAVAQSWDAGQAAARAPGMFGKVAGLGGGMALAALGAVPGGKALAGKAERELLKRLPPSASLAGIPLPEDAFLARMARREQVPLEQARSSQNWMDWERFKSGEHPGAMFKGFEDAPVAVRREDGEFVILDGHHRTTAALNRGDKNMDMYVVNARDYAPEVMGRAPSKNNGPNTDDLLAELLGISPAPLAMDEASRMARAAEQGFTIPFKHGSPDMRELNAANAFEARTRDHYNHAKGAVFEKVSQPIYGSPDHHIAASYADDRRAFDYQNAEPGVFDGLASLQNPLRFNAGGKEFSGMSVDALRSRIPEEKQAAFDAIIPELRLRNGNLTTGNLEVIAQKLGHDGFIIDNVKDTYNATGKPGRVVAVFDPANIRSKFAAFDPAKRGSANLLAGLGVGAMVAPSMFGNRGGER